MYRLITTTTDSQKNVKLIVDNILSSKLSPCIQVIKNIESFYVWDGEVENNLEYLILIKCESRNEARITELILNSHTYEVPEIIASNFDILNPDYASWFSQNSI